MAIGLNQQNIDPEHGDRIPWLAGEIFKAFPESVTGLVFYVLDWGCLYYQRKFVGGEIDRRFGIYRNADGLCEACMVWWLRSLRKCHACQPFGSPVFKASYTFFSASESVCRGSFQNSLNSFQTDRGITQ